MTAPPKNTLPVASNAQPHRKVSLCYAVYQNAETLPSLLQRSIAVMNENFPDLQHEYVFVDDGSTDASLRVLVDLKQQLGDDRIVIVSFTRNFGQVAAIAAGWEYATGDAVINLAADLQDPPEQCVPMIREWLSGADIVISYRRTHATTLLNRLTSRIAYRLLTKGVPDGGFDFTLLSRRALAHMLTLCDRNRFYQHDILWLGYAPVFLPYDKQERPSGRSAWSFVKRLNYFLTGYFNISYFPLRAMSFLGAFVSFLGFAYTGIIIYTYFVHSTPFQGWAPLMVVQLVIGGLLMMMLGTVGEYIWRIFAEVKARPRYLVRDVL